MTANGFGLTGNQQARPRELAIAQHANGTQQVEVTFAQQVSRRLLLSRLVTQALTSPHGAALDPGVAETLSRSAADTARRQEDQGHPACLLVPDLIRAPMARLLKRAAPRLKVLGHSEIPDTHSIRIGSIIGGTA